MTTGRIKQGCMSDTPPRPHVFFETCGRLRHHSIRGNETVLVYNDILILFRAVVEFKNRGPMTYGLSSLPQNLDHSWKTTFPSKQ